MIEFDVEWYGSQARPRRLLSKGCGVVVFWRPVVFGLGWCRLLVGVLGWWRGVFWVWRVVLAGCWLRVGGFGVGLG